MKKLNFFRSTLAALSLAFLGACSTSQYTFAPATGSYHETITKKQTEKPEPVAYATTERATAEATPVANEQTEASTALAHAFNSQRSVSQESNASVNAETKTSKAAAKESVKQLKQNLKSLKKKVKDGKDTQGLGLNSNVKLLLILGLAFILVGALLGVGIIYTIGAILLIIGLVLLLMEIL